MKDLVGRKRSLSLHSATRYIVNNATKEGRGKERRREERRNEEEGRCQQRWKEERRGKERRQKEMTDAYSFLQTV